MREKLCVGPRFFLDALCCIHDVPTICAKRGKGMAGLKDDAKLPLTNLSSVQLQKLAERLTAISGLPINGGGWQSGIDQNLPSEAVLAVPAIRKRGDTLSPRWADVYLNDLRQKLAGLDNDRRQYLELNARLTGFLLEQYELNESEKIQDDEISAGWYDFPYKISAKELAAQEEWATASGEVVYFYDEVIGKAAFTEVLENFEKAVSQRAWLAQASMYSPYLTVHNQYAAANAPANYLYARDPILNPGPPLILQPTPAGNISDARPLHNWVYLFTKTAAAPEIVSYQISFKTQNRLARASASSSALLAEAKSIATDWSQKDIDFRRRRAELNRTTNALKRKALSDQDGPLNLVPHLSGMRTRFVDQLADALAMAEVIQRGFATCWTWTTGASPPVPSTWNDQIGSFLDELLKWQAQAERSIVSQLHRESAGVVSVSLRNLVGETAWKKALTATQSGKPFKVSFQVRSHLFEPYIGVRFRGLSAYTSGVSDQAAGVWRGNISLPQNAIVIDSYGKTVAINQPRLMTDLGRILTRENPKPSDVVGSAQLRNLSPISDPQNIPQSLYEITIAATSSGGITMSSVKDISLDILFSYCQ